MRLNSALRFITYFSLFNLFAFSPSLCNELKDQTLTLGSSQLFKLIIAQTMASNRIEYDYVFPLVETESERFFVDTKVFLKERPLVNASSNADFIDGYGQSVRLGVRSLFNNGTSYRGASFGYDSLWKKGYYYQQIGTNFEYTSSSYQLVLTTGVPINSNQASSSALASANLQLSFPTGLSGLSFQPRIYAVGSSSTGNAIGGQVQFTYSFDRSASFTFATNHDRITGTSASLTYQILFPTQRSSPNFNLISPTIVNGFAGAVSNTGSRIIRLADVPDASGN
jgi:hypothetical protein